MKTICSSYMYTQRNGLNIKITKETLLAIFRIAVSVITNSDKVALNTIAKKGEKYKWQK